MVLAVLLELTGRQRDGTPRSPKKPPKGRHSMTARSLPVPDGLDGMRLDQAVSRLFGLSRTAAATLVEAGDALVDGVPAAQVRQGRAPAPGSRSPCPPPVTAPVVVAEPVHGMKIVYSDDDIVVVDKPVGVAAHPSPGWTGPTVIGGLAAMGQNVATSGAAERQGVVHRLDVGTTGLMVVAKSELAYSALKRAFKEREVDKRYHAVVQGHLDPLRGTIDAPIDRHPTADYRFAVMSDGKPSVTHYDTLEAFRSASLIDVKLETGPYPPDPGALLRDAAPVRRRPHLRRRSDPGGPAEAGPAVAARPRARLPAPAYARTRCGSSATTLTTWSTRWTCSATRADAAGEGGSRR